MVVIGCRHSHVVDFSALIFLLPYIKSIKEGTCIEVTSYFLGIFSLLMILRSFALYPKLFTYVAVIFAKVIYVLFIPALNRSYDVQPADNISEVEIL